MPNMEKKLAQLPAGWKIDGAGFRLECLDGMHCKIVRVEDGYVCTRHHADETAQSAGFCDTWKEVVAIANA